MAQEDVNSIEITKYDLERMRGAPPNDRYAKFLRKKEELRKLSKERYNKWPNTIEAMREKRLADRRREMEKIEEELCKQDALNAKNRAERRRQQIEKANKMLKVAHMGKAKNKIMISNILEERQAHIEYKKHMDHLWAKQEEKWVDFQRRQREGWREEERRIEEKRKEAVQTLKKGRLDQLEERKQQVQLMREALERDKQQLRKQAQEDEQIAKEKEEEKKRRSAQAVKEFIEINKEQERRKAQQKEKIKEEERRIAEYAAHRDKLEEERKEARRKKEAEKLAQREIMIARLEKQLLEARTDKDSRELKQAKQLRDAEDLKLQKQAERERAEWEQCDHFRKQQIRLRKERKERDKSDEMEEAMEVMALLRATEGEEIAQERAARDKRVCISRENLRLAAERRERELRDREEQIKEYQEAHAELEKDREIEDIDEADLY